MLLICGRNRVGKTTFATELAAGNFCMFSGWKVYARAGAPKLTAWSGAKVVNFADPIRAIVAAMYQLGPTEFDAAKDSIIPANPGEFPNDPISARVLFDMGSAGLRVPLSARTPRDAMIDIGEHMKLTFGENYWADIALDRGGPRAIYGDYRFPVESARAKQRGETFVLEVTREWTDRHWSTTADYVVAPSDAPVKHDLPLAVGTVSRVDTVELARIL